MFSVFQGSIYRRGCNGRSFSVTEAEYIGVFVYVKRRMFELIADVILVTNGVYDIICATSILFLPSVPIFHLFSHLHSDMFVDKDDFAKRMLAYWIYTYGFVRLLAGIHFDIFLYLIACATYILETAAVAFEACKHNETEAWRGFVVGGLSTMILALLLLRLA